MDMPAATSDTRPGRETPPQLVDFRARCAALTDADLEPAESLYAWSVANYRQFWATFLTWTGLAWEGSADVVCTSDDVEHAVFFPDVRLNYTENLLRPLPEVSDDSVALTAVHGDGTVERITRGGLRRRVAAAATALARDGVSAGDRLVVIAPNNARAAVAALAVAALGAAVSTAMPGMGPTALLDRFAQVEPVGLLIDRAGSGDWDGVEGDVLSTLLAGLPTVRSVMFLDGGPVPALEGVRTTSLDTTVEHLGGPAAPWPRVPFNAPLFVMFSSGTSGPPKAMVHGVGGTLLEHVKEHRLHNDMRADDVYFHHSTTAWMVWNRHLSTLASGAQIVVYDGPLRGPETLWELVDRHRVTVFGTSPAYLQLCQDAEYRPADEVDLSSLRAVLSMGAILEDWQYDWFAEAVGSVALWSSSGGTDILGAFVLSHPELPVPRGRIQTRSLGMDVAAVDESGNEVVGVVGELVCRNPFPSRPVGFLRDPDGRRYHDAYFAQNPGMWTHGDLIDVAADGTSRIYGRSDGVLNIDGVRIGPAEIYTVLRGVPEVLEAMAVQQRHPEIPGASRLVLLVVLRAPTRLDEELTQRIRFRLRTEASPAHVPSLVLQVAELPVTYNGKPSERAARDTLDDRPVANLGALRNPQSLAGITAAFQAAQATDVPVVVEDGQDEIEKVVTRLWRRTLGAAADDAPSAKTFTDLGGTSRQAVTMVRQIRTTLGRDVLVDAFLNDPTLPGLVAAARNATRSVDAPPVIVLAAGEAGRPPLFIVQDVYGDLDVYWTAAQLLTGTGRVYGLRTGVLRPDGTRRSIEDLAADHVQQIQQTALTGPIGVAGYSFGGQVAYEVARRLVAAGREVDHLALIDTRPAPALLRRAERLLNAVTERLALVVMPSIRNVTYRELLRLRLHPEQLDDDQRLYAQAGPVVDAYRAGPYSGPVTYLLARRQVPLQPRIRPWRRAARRLTVVEVPGAHHEVLNQDNVSRLASGWSAALAARAPLTDE